MSTHYSSNLNNQEWILIESLIPPAKPGGRPRTVMRYFMLCAQAANGVYYRTTFRLGEQYTIIRYQARIHVIKRHREIRMGLNALWDKGFERKFAFRIYILKDVNFLA